MLPVCCGTTCELQSLLISIHLMTRNNNKHWFLISYWSPITIIILCKPYIEVCTHQMAQFVNQLKGFALKWPQTCPNVTLFTCCLETYSFAEYYWSGIIHLNANKVDIFGAHKSKQSLNVTSVVHWDLDSSENVSFVYQVLTVTRESNFREIRKRLPNREGNSKYYWSVHLRRYNLAYTSWL